MVNTSATSTTLFLGQNGEQWDFWLICSVIFAFLAAGAVGVATIGSIFAHKREAAASDLALEKFKEKTKDDVALASKASSDAAFSAYVAGKSAINAQIDVDSAKIEIAKQKTLAAEADAQAQQAILASKRLKFQTLALQANISPRILSVSGPQVEPLKQFIPSKFSIRAVPFDGEAIRLAGQIESINMGIKWPKADYGFDSRISDGVTIVFGDGSRNFEGPIRDAADTICQILQNSSISARVMGYPTHMPGLQNLEEGEIRVLVGTKTVKYIITDKASNGVEETSSNPFADSWAKIESDRKERYRTNPSLGLFVPRPVPEDPSCK